MSRVCTGCGAVIADHNATGLCRKCYKKHWAKIQRANRPPSQAPCFCCGEEMTYRRPRLLCDRCTANGWRAKTCPACGQHPLHHRDYTAGPYQHKNRKILKCGWCRARDNAGPEMLA